MKTKNKQELHAKSLTELTNLVSQAKDALASLRLDQAQKKLKNTSQLSSKRKEIAQMMTIIRGKELYAQSIKKVQIPKGRQAL